MQETKQKEIREKLAEEIREKLAELEHEQWETWSRSIANVEKISPERLARWERLWDTQYYRLSEPEKDQDRVWADKVIAVFSTLLAERDAEVRKLIMDMPFQMEMTANGEMKSMVSLTDIINKLDGK